MLVFNIESSKKRGFGHLSRSLKIAELFKKEKIHFFINNNFESKKILKKQKISYSILKKNKHYICNILKNKKCKLLINDCMKLENFLVKICKKNKIPILNFDGKKKDLDKADVTINPFTFSNIKQNKRDFFFGSKYILNEKKKIRRKVRKKITSILIMFGGSDTYNLTAQCINKLKFYKYKIGVICGPLTRLKRLKNIKVYKYPKNIFDVFYKYDLLICGGGLIPFEAAASGLPSFIISCEKHEELNANYLSKKNLSIYLGNRKKIAKMKLNFNIDLNFLSKNCLKTIKPRGRNLIKKIINKLLKKNA